MLKRPPILDLVKLIFRNAELGQSVVDFIRPVPIGYPVRSSLLHDEAEDENHGCGEDIVATVRVVFGPQHTDIFVLNRFHFAIWPSRLSHPILAHVNLLLPMKNARRQLLVVVLFVFNKVRVNLQYDHRIARASSNVASGPQSTQ